VLYHSEQTEGISRPRDAANAGANPARQGYGGEAAGLQRRTQVEMLRSLPIRAYSRLRPCGIARRAGARGVRAPALPDRDRFDHDPHRAWQERLGDLSSVNNAL